MSNPPIIPTPPIIWDSRVLKQVKMKQKKKRGFLRMLLGTLGANLLGNLLSG